MRAALGLSGDLGGREGQNLGSDPPTGSATLPPQEPQGGDLTSLGGERDVPGVGWGPSGRGWWGILGAPGSQLLPLPDSWPSLRWGSPTWGARGMRALPPQATAPNVAVGPAPSHCRGTANKQNTKHAPASCCERVSERVGFWLLPPPAGSAGWGAGCICPLPQGGSGSPSHC